MRKFRLAHTSFSGSQILEAKISHQHSAFVVCSCRDYGHLALLITSTRTNFRKQEAPKYWTGNTTHESCSPRRNQTKEHQKDTNLHLYFFRKYLLTKNFDILMLHY